MLFLLFRLDQDRYAIEARQVAEVLPMLTVKQIPQAPPEGIHHDDFLAEQGAINRIVHDSVAAHGGSISAEHGIGALKRDELPRYKSQVELQLMRAVKAALDPLGIMNPGKIL